MKNIIFLLGVGAAALMSGCVSRTVDLAGAVGPNPGALENGAAMGRLQVYSRMRDRSDDRNQGGEGISEWRQHTDYGIYTLQGQAVKHVDNTTGHYAEAPEQVALPAGSYMVLARARDYFWVEVPVTIEPGLTTQVHLDDKWQPQARTPKAELVTLPDGNPVGWRSQSPRSR